MEKEIWKDVVGYEGYYMVSNMGRIKNIKERMNTCVGRILIGGTNPQGYRISKFYKDGVRFYKTLHSVVAEAFLGKRKDGYCVNHKDGNKKNNCIENLEYITVHENNVHAKENGLLRPNYGEKSGTAKLKNKDIYDIRNKYKNKENTQKELAEMYGVAVPCISRIVNRKRWGHLK